MTIPDLLRRLTTRPTPPAPREIAFADVAEAIAEYPAAEFEAHRVLIYERATVAGENVFHLALAFQPYIWADMANATNDRWVRMGALIMLDVWAKVKSGAYVMRYEDVKS